MTDDKAKKLPKGAPKIVQEPRKGGLGRGLAALIPSGPTSGSPRLGDGAADVILGGTKGARQASSTTAPPAKPSKLEPRGVDKQAVTPADGFGATYREIPLGEIVPNPQQPRQVFDEEALAELVHSIREFGLMQPIVVRRAADDSGYEIIMGERRWRASSKAGLRTIPAIVRETDDGDMLRDALLENIHRVQLNPLEEASAYQQLLEEFGVTQTELADRLGRSRPVITNTLRLLTLPVAVQRRVAAGVLSSGHARAIAGVKLGDDTSAAQDHLADRVVAEGLSVRATEEAVTLLNRNGAPAEKKQATPVAQPEAFIRAADRLADEWDTKVTVTMGRRKGKMVVEFGDQEDFERILALIEGQG
ncbi:putative chromosome-partitioning protein ParB [Corynebacterium atrinae]|uniref:ParB/RepB/Spo0J family partition protein n=1 Tax=Corynebacterium atrinae TaxID=1336740 RepID=UPI0025B2DF87|nr:ParB/RepB/Spo0J family partition protein [Corynebacterium atrinae]WJY64669.1 putative chromosome-partitioning protein ParB [Corynebacterium atrinae]